MIYFDNSATSYHKPFCVIKAVNKFIRAANPGRSGHFLSQAAAMEIIKARLTIKELVCCPSEDNIIFCQNCTEALNTAIYGSKKTGGHIIYSCFEHNSVLRPLQNLKAEFGIETTLITPKNKIYITHTDVEKAIKSNTYLVIVNHISNVTGNKNDIKQIGELCRKKGILFLCDCAQSAGHVDIDMQKDNISMLTIAGHKGLYAPQSIGVLCLNDKVALNPLKRGGTGTNSVDANQPSNFPERLESGTLSTTLIAGLRAGTNFVIKHFDKHAEKTKMLTFYLHKKLKEIKNIKIYSSQNHPYGVVLFNLAKKDSVEVAEYLNSHKIFVRSGLHCAPLAHEFLGTMSTGAVRVSLDFNNSKKQINKMCYLLNLIN